MQYTFKNAYICSVIVYSTPQIVKKREFFRDILNKTPCWNQMLKCELKRLSFIWIWGCLVAATIRGFQIQKTINGSGIHKFVALIKMGWGKLQRWLESFLKKNCHSLNKIDSKLFQLTESGIRNDKFEIYKTLRVRRRYDNEGILFKERRKKRHIFVITIWNLLSSSYVQHLS